MAQKHGSLSINSENIFPMQPILLKNIKIKQMKIRLLDISDLVSILHLW